MCMRAMTQSYGLSPYISFPAALPRAASQRWDRAGFDRQWRVAFASRKRIVTIVVVRTRYTFEIFDWMISIDRRTTKKPYMWSKRRVSGCLCQKIYLHYVIVSRGVSIGSHCTLYFITSAVIILCNFCREINDRKLFCSVSSFLRNKFLF